MMMDEMGCTAGMGWMMGGMAVVGIMVLALLALGIAALIKYLRR